MNDHERIAEEVTGGLVQMGYLPKGKRDSNAVSPKPIGVKLVGGDLALRNLVTGEVLGLEGVSVDPNGNYTVELGGLARQEETRRRASEEQIRRRKEYVDRRAGYGQAVS